jgi:hypothetical protein
LELPHVLHTGPDRGQVVWGKPSYPALYAILKHPAYAGAYTYGKHHRVRLAGAEGRVVVRTMPMEEWSVLKREAFPGYISWEQYLKNQARLRENAQGATWTQGAPRAGQALLQGIVRCGRCGRPLHVCYGRQASYVCDWPSRTYGEPRCQIFTVAHVDQAVVQVFLQAVEPFHLEAALAAVAQLDAQRQALAEQWQHRLERARYEADLARRRYERVDPDKRLVAAELEQQWEDKLQAIQGLEREWEQVQTHAAAPLSEAEQARIRQLAADVPALWQAPTTRPEDRKRLLRCLIQDVTLDSYTRPGWSQIHIRWHTGTTTTVQVERPRSGRPPARGLAERVQSLAQTLPDDQIAARLNAEGVGTASGLPWTLGRVRGFRHKHNIPSGCPYISARSGPRGDGLVKAAEAAQRLNTSFSMIADWFRRGWLVGCQRQVGAPLWIRLSEEDEKRWNGSMALQADLIPVKAAPAAWGLTSEQMSEAVRAGRILTYRLFVNNRWRWYVQPPASNPQD